MLKASHPEYSSAFSLLPLMDEDNTDSANYLQQESSLVLPDNEAALVAAQIRQNTDIADIVRDLGYNCTSSVESFREAIKVRFRAMSTWRMALTMRRVTGVRRGHGRATSLLASVSRGPDLRGAFK
jgi:hypothetical protein